ncbi:UvrD-helicase domain-containing protein, partial [Frankia sp. Cpl3]|nr:UvrD-helicase domain-containing protein [Frankia sp. Cpl3]
MIFLNEDAYSRIPVWRLWAEKGKLRCPACQAPLQLIAGVSFEPFFQHPAENICALQGDEQPPQEFLSYGLAEAAAATEARGGGQQKGTAATTGDGIIPQGTAADGGHGEMRQGDDITTIGSFRLPKKRQIGNSQPSSPVQPPVYTFRKRLTPKHTIQHLAESYSEPLHPQQQRAVRTTEGPLLILAGAGSGKTRVMTARTAYLIQAAGVQPRSIMVVTFTNKAADEMKHRLAQQLTAQQARELITGTFHSIFYRMLQHHQPDRWAQDRLLKQEWQKRRLLRETGALQQEPELAALKESEVEAALAIVSRWKNEFVLPKQLAMLEFPTEEEKQARLLYP